MSHARIIEMLEESGFDHDEMAEVVDVLAPLGELVDTAPAPSAELAALFGPVPSETAAHPTTSHSRARGAAVSAVVIALSSVGATGLSAAANTLPRPFQHEVAQFSRDYLPFDLPEPPPPGQPFGAELPALEPPAVGGEASEIEPRPAPLGHDAGRSADQPRRLPAASPSAGPTAASSSAQPSFMPSPSTSSRTSSPSSSPSTDEQSESATPTPSPNQGGEEQNKPKRPHKHRHHGFGPDRADGEQPGPGQGKGKDEGPGKGSRPGDGQGDGNGSGQGDGKGEGENDQGGLPDLPPPISLPDPPPPPPPSPPTEALPGADPPIEGTLPGPG